MAALAMTHSSRPLADMIRAANRDGLTWRELAQRARDRGHPISAAHLNNLAHGHVAKMPRPQEIAAIASAIGRTRDEVFTAAMAEFYPEDYHSADVSSGPGRRLVAVPDGATEDDLAEIARLVNAWWEARRRD